MTAACAPQQAHARVEHVLARAVVLFRIGGVIGLLLALTTGAFSGRANADLSGSWLVVSLAVAESAALCTTCLVRRAVPALWAMADLGFTAALLVVDSLLDSLARQPYIVYPYAVIASVPFGVTFGSAGTALVGAFLLAAANALPGWAAARSNPFEVFFDAGTFFPNVLAAYFVARMLRGMAREIDATRELAAQRALELQRLRTARDLHDGVLQTLEMLSVQRSAVADEEVRGQIAADAAWLRSYVSSGGRQQAVGGLIDRLEVLVADFARQGLNIQFHRAQVEDGDPRLAALAEDVREALLGAAKEALTNVLKHAGVDHAALRLVLDDKRVIVTVVDQGRGFDPGAVASGRLGLAESIRARIDEAGGYVELWSAPGEGTSVELSIFG